MRFEPARYNLLQRGVFHTRTDCIFGVMGQSSGGYQSGMGVSQVTVRKDLDALEAKGFIRRTHGFAELNTTDHISSHLAYHYEE